MKARNPWIFRQTLNELSEFDPDKTRMIELHYFLGCTANETAEVLQVSTRTVERSLRFALAMGA